MNDYNAWLEGMASGPWALASVFCLLVSSWGLGRLLLSGVLGLRLRKRAFEPLIAIGAGLDVWASLALLFGSLGLLSPLSARAVLFVSAAASLVWMALRRQPFARAKAAFLANWPFYAVLLALFALCLGNALCPPAGLGVDEQTYQLPVPLRWAADSFPYVYKDLPYSGYPSCPELLFWLAMEAGKVSAPRLLSLCVQALGLASLYLLLRGRLRPLGALALSLAVFLGCAHVVFSGEVFAEPFVLLNFLCGLMLLDGRSAMRGSPWPWTLALGLFAGAAAAAKLTALALWVALGLGVLFLKSPLRAKAVAVAGFLAGSLFAAPFYLRPLLQTGNPFHPYLAWLFSSDPARVEMSRHYHMLGGSSLFGLEGLGDAILSPLRLCYADAIYDGYWGGQFPVIMILALCSLYLARKSSAMRGLYPCVAAAFLYVFWLCASQQARFLEPAFVLMAIAAAASLRALSKNVSTALLVSIAAAIAISVPWQGWIGHYVISWRALLDGVPPQRFLEAVWRDGLAQAYAELDKAAPRDAKVMIVFEKRILDCPRRALVATPLYQEAFFTPPPQGAPDAIDRAVMDEILRSGASYLLVANSLDKPMSLPEVSARVAPFIDSLKRLVASGRLAPIWGSPSHVLLKVEQGKETVK